MSALPLTVIATAAPKAAKIINSTIPKIPAAIVHQTVLSVVCALDSA
jgi:hypothetical protein